MPGKGTPPGPALYPECSQPGLGGTYRHRRNGTPTCAHCRAEMAAHAARYRKQRYLAGGALTVPALGSQRRVRALARMGWDHQAVGDGIGLSRRSVSEIFGQAVISRRKADRIARFYREHAWETGPSRVARGIAERRGWPGPMDWANPDDPDEVPACEIEKAHREALAIEYNRRAYARLRAQSAQAREARLIRRREARAAAGRRQEQGAMATCAS